MRRVGRSIFIGRDDFSMSDGSPKIYPAHCEMNIVATAVYERLYCCSMYGIRGLKGLHMVSLRCTHHQFSDFAEEPYPSLGRKMWRQIYTCVSTGESAKVS